MAFSPVEYEHVVRQGSGGQPQHQGHVERLFVGEHPGLLRQGEVEIVSLSEPEENVLQSGATSLVGFSKGNLQIFLSYKNSIHCVVMLPVSSGSTFQYNFVSLFLFPKNKSPKRTRE